MTTEADIKQWVGRATPPRADTGWYGMCAGLTDRVIAQFTGGSRQWYDSATDARRASGALNPDATAAPAGAIHYWSYYGNSWDGTVGDWGHVTIDIRGGGTATLSATKGAFDYWGLNAGLISVAAQTGRAGMKYLGWARTYGAAAPLTLEMPAGENHVPGATPAKEEDDMSMNTIRHPNGTIYFADDLGADHLGDYKTDDIGLGEFLEASARVFGGADQLTAREFDIATAIATRRWERKKAEIVAAVVAALKN